MKAVLIALVGAGLSVLAFPPFGPGLLIVVGMSLFFWGLRIVEGRRHALAVGSVYGLAFFGGLMWWLAELELIALVLVPVQAAYYAVFAWWLGSYNRVSSGRWVLLATGGWALTELIRYRFPVGGLEWGAAGYALSDSLYTRFPAAIVGTTGLTVLVGLAAAVIASALVGRFENRLLWALALVMVIGLSSVALRSSPGDVDPLRVAIVQGSTPCPFEHCAPDERLRTFQQHLALNQSIEAGSVDLVVWSEGSTGAFNADPVQNPEIGDAIAAEARRIGAWFLVGSDRPISETHWVNANVVFDPKGVIVGEYLKQHGVPFGEYIPWRPVFDWIPALDQVPRDMIPGNGPVVFDIGDRKLGSVISFEGGFARYPRQHRSAGSDLMVVATNEGSYGMAPTSDQFIGMTRMRAVELGVPLIHAAVTGKSTIVDREGETGPLTGLGTQEVLYATVAGSSVTPYSVTGDLLMIVAALVGGLTWWRTRTLVGSATRDDEKE